MRKLIVVLVVLLLLVVGALALALGRLNAFLTANQATFAAQIGTAIGRRVGFDSVGVALRLAPQVRITNLRIADDSGDDDLLRADVVSVGLDLLAALLGRVRLYSVTVDAPTITIVRTAYGTNLDALGRPTTAHAGTARARRNCGAGAEPPRYRLHAAPSPRTAVPAPGPQRADEPALPTLAHAAIRNGTIRYVDRRTDPPRQVSAHQARRRRARSGRRPRRPSPCGRRCSAPRRKTSPRADTISLHRTLHRSTSPCARTAWTIDQTPPASRRRGVAARRAVVARTRSGPSWRCWDPRTRCGRLTVDATTAAVRYGEWLDKPPGVPLSLRAEGTYSVAEPVR